MAPFDQRIEYFGPNSGTHLHIPTTSPQQRARDLLSRHPHFCGRVDSFEFEWKEDVLVVKGRVPTYYLKQLLQSALKQLDGVRIDDRVDVARPEGQGEGRRF
jgi:hypothetical protein